MGETNEQKIARLEKENQKQLEQIEKMQEAGQATQDPLMGRYMNELLEIQKVGRVDTNKIQLKEIVDHKNISLWTRLGKRVGPLHPHNAEQTFKRFWSLGIQLTVKRPTQKQIDSYMRTKEYKEWKAKQDLDRKRKIKTKSKTEIEKLVKSIALMSGKSADEINKVFDAHEVQPLSAGRT